MQAAKELNVQLAKVRSRLQPKSEAFVDNPRPSGVVTLEDTENHDRICVGHYRIVYDIEDDGLRVLVINVGHWQDVYKTDVQQKRAPKRPSKSLSFLEKSFLENYSLSAG